MTLEVGSPRPRGPPIALPSLMRWIAPQLNASDARGIDVVRDQISSFASRRSLFGSGTKLVILDEADSMTNDAQFALRRGASQGGLRPAGRPRVPTLRPARARSH